MTTPQYKNCPQKIIFSLNSLANLPSGIVGSTSKIESIAKNLLNEIFENADIIKLIGEWKLVWGPKVYERKIGPFKILSDHVADNAMYIAQSVSDPEKFVVAISGTNPISTYGWIHEDLEINPPHPWTYGNTEGKITNGTNVGLEALLNLKEEDTTGLTFVKYLANQVSENQVPLNVEVTGHSLGGALSPTVALALLDSQGVSLNEANGWDPESTSEIHVTPSAGPTPGDEVWRDYYDNRLGDKTDRLWNAIDVVPHAWQISMLEEIPKLYHPSITPTTGLY